MRLKNESLRKNMSHKSRPRDQVFKRRLTTSTGDTWGSHISLLGAPSERRRDGSRLPLAGRVSFPCLLEFRRGNPHPCIGWLLLHRSCSFFFQVCDLSEDQLLKSVERARQFGVHTSSHPHHPDAVKQDALSERPFSVIRRPEMCIAERRSGSYLMSPPTSSSAYDESGWMIASAFHRVHIFFLLTWPAA